MSQVVVPLSIVYPDSYFEGDILQGTDSDKEFDDKQFNPKKRKASFSGGAMDAKAGGSSAIGDSSTLPPSKKIKLIIDLEDLAK